MSKPKKGTVYLVGAGPGDAGLLTLRGAELLARADVVIHDTLVNPAVLRLAPGGAEFIAAGNRGGQENPTPEAIQQVLLDRARAGGTVVLLKRGDPYVFGRGGEETAALREAGIPFEVVPGISSFSAVASYAGIPLTHRGLASAFTVVTGHQDPTQPGGSVDWAGVARAHGTKVVLMAIEHLADITTALAAGGLAGDTPVALIRWGTTGAQKTLIGTLADIAVRAAEAGFTSPAVAVIGEVVRLRPQLNWFERRPLSGRRVVVPLTRDHPGGLPARLAELGADVLEIPTNRTAPPTDRQTMIEALAGLGEYDWAVFTSVPGVEAFFGAVLAAFEDIRSVGNLRFAAIGSATAARLQELRLRVDARPAESTGPALVEAVGAVESLENLRVLLARAEGANPALAPALEQAGAIVDDVAFYRTVPETADPAGAAELLVTEGADWIAFPNSATVTNLNERVNLGELVARHPGLRLASMGPETTKAIVALGLQASVEAAPHTLDALAAALAKVGG